MINCVINKLIDNIEPDEAELNEAFDEMFSGLSDEITSTSFITLLKEKEDLFQTKSMCLSCAIKSARGSISKIRQIQSNLPTFEILQFKNFENYFDISFVMDIILASNDILTTKYIFPFQKTQSFETLKTFNIKPKDVCDDVIENLEKTNFLYFNISNTEPYYKYTNNILRNLPFKNILNIVEKFLSPINVKNQFFGVETKDDVEKFANICLNIGNHNTLILNSGNILPFASIEGETKIAEAWKNKIFTYALTPELLGLRRFKLDELKFENIEQNKEMIINLLDNKEKGAIYDFTILNSALALYIVKKASSIMDGLKLAKKTIDDGLAKEKLVQIQEIYS